MSCFSLRKSVDSLLKSEVFLASRVAKGRGVYNVQTCDAKLLIKLGWDVSSLKEFGKGRGGGV